MKRPDGIHGRQGWLARLAVLLCAASPCADAQVTDALEPFVRGQLQSDAIREASGLGCLGDTGPMLVVNDGGSAAELHIIGSDGTDLGRLPVPNARNVDWEDLAVLRSAEDTRVVIADIGDNESQRDSVSLLVVTVSSPSLEEAEPIRTLRFAYPNGPRDAEALAVDGEARAAYILSKRTLPPELFRLSLATTTDDAVQLAERLGAVGGLRAPTGTERRLPALFRWQWQPTAMDFSADGRFAAVLTYEAVYLFEREAGQSWYEALQGKARLFPLAGLPAAESLCLAGRVIWLTTEGRRAPLVSIPFEAEGWR